MWGAGVRVSQVKPSNCFRLHPTSSISKRSTIPVPDSLWARPKISFTFRFLDTIFYPWWCETCRVIQQQVWMNVTFLRGQTYSDRSYIFSWGSRLPNAQDIHPGAYLLPQWGINDILIGERGCGLRFSCEVLRRCDLNDLWKAVERPSSGRRIVGVTIAPYSSLYKSYNRRSLTSAANEVMFLSLRSGITRVTDKFWWISLDGWDVTSKKRLDVDSDPDHDADSLQEILQGIFFLPLQDRGSCIRVLPITEEAVDEL